MRSILWNKRQAPPFFRQQKLTPSNGEQRGRCNGLQRIGFALFGIVAIVVVIAAFTVSASMDVL